jgi:hypothetical protein
MSAFAQNPDLSELQGLKLYDNSINLEISGYDIYITTLDGSLNNPDNIDEINYTLGLGEIITQYSNNNLAIENKITEAESIITPGLRTAQTAYLLQKDPTTLLSILFLTINKRDKKLEQTIVEEYLKNELSSYIIKGNKRFFNFIGRTITPNEKWEMAFPHSVSSEGVQLRWSVFKTISDAESDIKNRIMLDKNDMTVIMEENIGVTFEGVPTTATRVVYEDENSTYPLIAYYISQIVRGRNVSCIMSNYGHNKDDYYLNPLLEVIMRINELPNHAFVLPEPEPEPQEEYVYQSGTGSYFEPSNFMDIQVGVRVPVGNLSKVYSSAALFALYFKAFKVKATMFDIGLQVGMPSGKKYFNYYYNSNNKDITKAEVLLNLNARMRWEKRMRSNLRTQYYIGMGYESLSTDLYKETSVNEYGNEVDYTHSVRAMDFFGGINLKHKYVGLFLEYHYTPYSMFNKVESNFGNSAFHMGLVVTL